MKKKINILAWEKNATKMVKNNETIIYLQMSGHAKMNNMACLI